MVGSALGKCQPQKLGELQSPILLGDHIQGNWKQQNYSIWAIVAFFVRGCASVCLDNSGQFHCPILIHLRLQTS